MSKSKFTCLRDREPSKFHELVNGKCTRAHKFLVQSRRSLCTEGLGM